MLLLTLNGYGLLFPLFNDSTMLTSLQSFEFFLSPPKVVKDSSNASGIALGDSLSSQWWISSGTNLNIFEITKWYWTYSFSVLAFILFFFKWIAVTFAQWIFFVKTEAKWEDSAFFMPVICCPPPLNGEPILSFISLWFQMCVLTGIN